MQKENFNEKMLNKGENGMLEKRILVRFAHLGNYLLI